MNRDDTAAAPLGAVAVLSPSCATLTITLRGELDLAAEGLLQCLVAGAAASDATQLRLDLAGVTFCDAGGLRLLALAAADISAGGVGVAVTRPSAAVTRVIEIAMGCRAAVIMR